MKITDKYIFCEGSKKLSPITCVSIGSLISWHLPGLVGAGLKDFYCAYIYIYILTLADLC